MDLKISNTTRHVNDERSEFYNQLKVSGIKAINMLSRLRDGEHHKNLFRTEETISALSIIHCKEISNLAVIGPSGVGKTTFIYNLSQYVNDFDESHMAEINIAGLLAGCAYRGDFEKKLSLVIDLAMKYEIILYFDEAHALSMTGGKESGGIDAMNILKPYLTKNLKCIISTTTDESRILKNDIAFSRRFRFLELTPLSFNSKKKIIEDRFGSSPLIDNYFLNPEIKSKELYQWINDIDLLQSSQFVKEKYNEIYSK